MNIRHVEAFKALMEAGTVTGAAARLHVTQPAASKMLAHLEADIGVKLFERVKGRLVPTAEARAFYTEIERAFVGMEHLTCFAEDLKELRHGSLVIGVMPALAQFGIAEAVKSFTDSRDKVRISLQVRSSTKILEMAAGQHIDLGLGMLTTDDPAVACKPLFSVPSVCVLPEGHRLSNQDVVRPENLRDEPFISLSNLDRVRTEVDRVFDTAKVRRQTHVDTVLAGPACALVAEGLGVSVVLELVARHFEGRGLIIRPFEPLISFTIHVLRPRHRPHSALVDAFVDELRQWATQREGILADGSVEAVGAKGLE